MYKLLLVCVVFVVVALASFHPSLSQSTPNISFFITSAGSGNGDSRALLVEEARNGGTNSTRGARHQRRLSRKIEHVPIPA